MSPEQPNFSQAPIPVGIMGAAGYTGGEALRLLLNHPYLRVAWAHSRSQAGQPVPSVHPDLLGETDLRFTDTPDPSSVQAVLLCLGHGESRKCLAEHPELSHLPIVDLSQDFRLGGADGFIYGLPELNRAAIQKSVRVANPGCFATAIQLALLPLAAHGLLARPVHVSGITGSTGAGQSLQPTSHFSWRNGNVSPYKVFTHQHLAEIGQSLQQLQPAPEIPLHFVPYRGPFPRGIYATAYTETGLGLEEARSLYADYYQDHPFVTLTDGLPDLKPAVNTNKCLLGLAQEGGQLVIGSAIDNLLKGASGQAVQNLNLMLGLPETAGLRLKAAAF